MPTGTGLKKSSPGPFDSMLNSKDRALVKRDGLLPGLRMLLDTAQMERAIAQQLGGESGFSLTCDYLRYKPAVSCIARYRIAAGEKESWAYAKAFGKESDAKYGKLKTLQASSGEFGIGRLFFDRHKTVFSTFSNDTRLKVLRRLDEPEARSGIYQRLFKDLDRWNPDTYQVLAYKPERRLAARFCDTGGRCTVVKFYASGEFERIRKYRKRLSTPAGLPVQQWIGGSKSHRALVFDWLDGQPLSQVPQAARQSALAGAGQALARWHSSEQPGLRKRSRGPAVMGLNALADSLESFYPDGQARASGMATKAGRWWRTHQHERIPVHGDFDDSQVIIGAGCASLIDGDEAHLGNAVSDLACFRARAEYQLLLGEVTESSVERDQRTLVDAYREVRPGLSMDGFPGHVCWHLLHLLHVPFRSRQRQWAELTDRLLDRCEHWWEMT